jgi:hypothetical protein
MSTLFGNNISQTYQGLIKLADSTTGVTSTTQSFQDGLGNNIPIQVSNDTVNISGSFLVNGQPVSIETGSFATTGSNTFIGDQTITGSLYVSSSVQKDVIVDGQIWVSSSLTTATTSTTQPQLNIAGYRSATRRGTSQVSPGQLQLFQSSSVNGEGTIIISPSSGISGTNNNTLSSQLYAQGIGSSNTMTYVEYKGIYNLDGTVDVEQELEITSSGSLFRDWDNSGFDYSTYMSIAPNNGDNPSPQFTRGLGITGSLTELGNVYMLSPAFNSGSIKLNITGSSPVSQSNFIFGSTAGPTNAVNTGSIILSGSNNIVLTGVRTNTLGSGTYGYIGGNSNIMNVVPTLNTASLVNPTTSNNILYGLTSLNFTTSSLLNPVFNNNQTQGVVNINHQSGSINMNGNIVMSNGFTSNANITTLGERTTISQNLVAGISPVILNHNSSSITYQGNIGGGMTVTNNYTSSVFAGITVQGNIFNGTNNTLVVTGSDISGIRRQINYNIVNGFGNIINSNRSGSSTAYLVATSILGQELIVSASNTSNTVGGSTFVGRYNATGSLQESSQDTVFVVGTGTGAGSRRNAIHIDNNNNTRITGSVSISGSLSVNGSNVITGSVVTDRTGLITTGSAGTTQIITGSVKLGPPSNAGHSPSLIIGSFDNSNKAANITGSVGISGSLNVTGSLMLNGASITSSDRNGLINTGSAFSTQTIQGTLKISGSALQPLEVGSGPFTGRIDVLNAGPFLYRNTQDYNTVIGNAKGIEVGFTGSNNMLFTGFFLGFSSGSGNTVISGNGGANFRSGSQNTILGPISNLEFGNSNTIMGVGATTSQFMEDTLSIGAGGNSVFYKSGSSAPLQINGNTQITGSLNVINNSLTVTNQINGLYLSGSGGNIAISGDQNNVLKNSPGGKNIGIGDYSLKDETTGEGNIAIGDRALEQQVGRNNSLAIGNSALRFNQGQFNTAIGATALINNISGSLNFALGYNTLGANTSGDANLGFGSQALVNNVNGSSNLGLGNNSLTQNISGSGNIAIGNNAGYNETGSNNFYIGNQNYGSVDNDRSKSLVWGVLDNTTANQTLQINAATNVKNNLVVTGSLLVTNNINNLKIWTGSLNTNSIGIGDYTLNSQTGSSLNNIAIGVGALQTNVTGSNVVAIGGDALRNSVAGFNLAVGSSALQANTTGEYNIGIGQSAFQANTIGGKNTAIGWNSGVNNLTGSTNTIIGAQALSNNVNGSGNVAIGHYAGYYSTGSNGFYIGNENYGSLSNDQNKSLMYGEFNNTTNNQTLQINATTNVKNNLVVTGSLNVSGKTSIANAMNLTPMDPLPTGVVGDLAVSGSSLYFYNGAWTLIV